MAGDDDGTGLNPSPVCFICGQPAGGGEMQDGAHVLCSWGLSDHERRQKQIVKRRGFFPSLEALEAERSE